MAATSNLPPLPVKACEVQNHHFDSTKWNDFEYRDDDIVVSTAYKSGTTWCQNIIIQLLFQGKDKPENHNELYPWIDFRISNLDTVKASTERRLLKTHLKLNALKFSDKAKYIYIGRDGRDCFMSLINHYKSGNDLWYQLVNDLPGKD